MEYHTLEPILLLHIFAFWFHHFCITFCNFFDYKMWASLRLLLLVFVHLLLGLIFSVEPFRLDDARSLWETAPTLCHHLLDDRTTSRTRFASGSTAMKMSIPIIYPLYFLIVFRLLFWCPYLILSLPYSAY